jgi:hypothetical protein
MSDQEEIDGDDEERDDVDDMVDFQLATAMPNIGSGYELKTKYFSPADIMVEVSVGKEMMTPLNQWLGEKFYAHGSLEPEGVDVKLIMRITGEVETGIIVWYYRLIAD